MKVNMMFYWLCLGVIICFASMPVSAQAVGEAQIGFFEEIIIAPGSKVEVPVEIRGVEDLYAVDITVRFDPSVIQAVDADPSKDGIQPGLGTFLDAGLVLFNEVDNEEGVIRFVMTQVNPAEPKSGDGVLMVLYFESNLSGESVLAIESVDLAMRTGEAIAVEPVEGRLLVEAGAPQREGTPIPVQDPTLIIVIPTLTPTPTPTEIPPTPTSTVPPGELDEVQENGEVGLEIINQEDEAIQAGYTILDYWWAVVLVVLLVIGLAVYLFKTKKIV